MRQDIIFSLKGLSEIFDKTVTNELMEIWNKVLQDLSPQELGLAVKTYVLDPANVFFPRPGQIYGLARPQADPEETAGLIVEQIYNLLGPCGGDSYGVSLAEQRLCEFGKSYIQMLGGWSKFSNDMKYTNMDDLPIVKSQARRAIKALINRKKNDMSMLPESNAISLSSLGVTMKSLDEGSIEYADGETDGRREAEY